MQVGLGNQMQVQSYLVEKLTNALDATMKIAWDELKNIIDADVYNAYYPIWYERTNELLDNWEYIAPSLKGTMIESVLSFTKPISHSGSPLWQHGIREIDNQEFAEIINEERPIGNIAGFPDIDRNPFWDEFSKWCEANFENVFIQQCKLLGLDISNTFTYSIT